MFRALATLVALALLPAPVLGAAAANAEFFSRDAVVEWMDGYRQRPEPARLPAAVRALSKAGALRDAEAAGYHVGFAASVLGANPARADELVRKMLPLPASDQWFVVRAIAYSGLPGWRAVLRKAAPGLPARQEMIEQYLKGTLPTLAEIGLEASPGIWEKIRIQLGGTPQSAAVSFARNPELLDTLWGQYFASGDYGPVRRILALLPWSGERDSVEKLLVGSAAKYTLTSNAARYPDLLARLKDVESYQSDEVRKVLADAIKAAETMDTARVRKQQLAAIEDLKRKGPGSRRDMQLWGYVSQGVIAAGCIAAATVSLTALGLPCVIGGAVTSAAINYWSATQ